MNYTFKDIQDEVLKDIRSDKVSNIDPMRDMVRRHINRIIYECHEVMFFEASCDAYEFPLVLGQNTYLLAHDCMGVVNVRLIDTTTTPVRPWIVLDESQDEYDELYPAPIALQTNAQPGQAKRYRIVRFDGFIDRLPSVDYRVYSSDARDLSYVTFVGYSDSLRQKPFKVRVQLTGTTPVVLTPQPYLLTGFAKMDTFGKVTLERATVPPNPPGWTEVCALEYFDKSVFGYSIEFDCLPNKTYTCSIRYKKRPQLLVHDEEVPWGFPPEAMQVVIEGAKYLGLRDLADETRSAMAKAEYEKIKAELQRFFRPNLKNHSGIRWGDSPRGWIING